LVVDLRPAAGARLEQVKSLLMREIERRGAKDPFLLVCTGPKFPVRAPAVRGIAYFEPGRDWYKPEEPREFVRGMKVLPDDNGCSLGQIAEGAPTERLHSMVVFVPDGPSLTDPDRAEIELRNGSCRIFVVWLGESGSRSERCEQLKALAFRTRGQFVTLPSTEGAGAKSP
jgi:hypothetical protein